MTLEDAFAEMDRRIRAYRAGDTGPLRSLAPLLPRYGSFFTDLPLTEAFRWYNSRRPFAKRRHVGPSNDEIRRVFNVAQLAASSEDVRLASFDGDETLYDNRGRLEDADSPIVRELLHLLHERDAAVSLTTAVGSRNPDVYESRLEGLLNAIARRSSARSEVYVVGGQCNVLFRLDGETTSLRLIPDEDWKTEEMMAWSDDGESTLKLAESSLREVAGAFDLPMRFVRKETAVGALYCGDTRSDLRLYLDECTLEVRERLNRRRGDGAAVPFNVFNGGSDVFVDLGSKQHGIEALQRFLGVESAQTLHFGDQMTMTGNDMLVRRVAPTCWVRGSRDTELHLRWWREIGAVGVDASRGNFCEHPVV